MKKYFVLIAFLLFITGGLAYYFWPKGKPATRDYIIIKAEGDNVYSFELPFDIGVNASEVVKQIYIGNQAPKEILVKEGGVWKHEDFKYIFKKDSVIKVQEV